VPQLSRDQAKVLATKMETFYHHLSPAEQAHLNRALRHLADDPAEDVTAHASLAEYGLLLSLIALIV
jgi:hypothetical protein